MFRAARIDALITIGGDGSLTIGKRLHRGRAAGHRRAQDDRQRPRQDAPDVRLRHRGGLRLRVHRPAVLDGDVARPGDRGRGDGPLRRLDRAGVGHRRRAPTPSSSPRSPSTSSRWRRRSPSARRRGAKFSIVVVAEGAAPVGGDVSVLGQAVGQAEKLGGIGGRWPPQLEELTGKESRTVVLGHLLRGGVADRVRPPARAALRRRGRAGLEEGQDGVMVALNPPTGRLRAAERGDQPA